MDRRDMIRKNLGKAKAKVAMMMMKKWKTTRIQTRTTKICQMMNLKRMKRAMSRVIDFKPLMI